MNRVRVAPAVRTGAGVLVVLAVLGFPLGWVWSALAPGQRMRVVTAEGGMAPLQLESWHRFDALAIFLLLAFAAGVLIAIGLWSLRRWRGPGMLFLAVLGSLLTSWVALRIGLVIVDSRYEVPEELALGAVVERAPVLESMWVIVAAPTAVAITYGMLAACSTYQDLRQPSAVTTEPETEPEADVGTETE